MRVAESYQERAHGLLASILLQWGRNMRVAERQMSPLRGQTFPTFNGAAT